MIPFLAEHKLVFYARRPGPENTGEDFDSFADGVLNGEISDVEEARHIVKERDEVRNNLNGFNFFTKEDIDRWQKKLDAAPLTKLETEKLKKELRTEQKHVKEMVGEYTNTVDRHIKSAFTEESAKEFKKAFSNQSSEQKRAWYEKLQEEIRKRETLRKELLEIYPDISSKNEQRTLREQIYNWRRHEMTEKVIEFRERKKNTEEYTRKIQKDRVHFSDKSFEEFIAGFLELSTTEDQREWISKYEAEAKKRRELTAQFKEFSAQRQRSENKFWQLSRHEKVEHIEKLKMQLQSEFERSLNKYSDKEVPLKIKTKYRIYFASLNIKDKEYALSNIDRWLENDSHYELEYAKIPDEIKNLQKYGREKWERTPFDDKEQMLRDMNYECKLLNEADNLLKTELKEKTITKKTMKIYRAKFLTMGIAEKLVSLHQFNDGMKRRRSDVEQFNKLSKKTRSKFSNFWKGEKYAERHTILLNALEFEASQKDPESVPEEPLKPEQEKNLPEGIKQQIIALQSQANSLEAQGKIEQAIGVHKAVLLIDPKNTESTEKVKMLEAKICEEDELRDEKLFENLVTEIALSQPVAEERESMQITQQLIEDQEELENINQSPWIEHQQNHLDDEFAKNIDSAILSKTKGNKRIGRNGEIKKVETIDSEDLGREDGVERSHYKNLLRNKSSHNPLENIQIVDESGRKKTTRFAKEKLNERKKDLENTIKERAQKKLGKNKPNASIEDVEDVVDEIAL